MVFLFLEYDFKVVYKPRKKYVIVDALIFKKNYFINQKKFNWISVLVAKWGRFTLIFFYCVVSFQIFKFFVIFCSNSIEYI